MSTSTRATARLDAPTPTAAGTRATARRALGLVVCLGALVVVCGLSLAIGTRGVGLGTVIKAFTDHDPGSTAETVIRELRVPRTIIGLLAGAALGLSGALLQGLTRNPLADPGIMGINAGAAAAIVTSIVLFGVTSTTGQVWFGFLGAGLATVVVYTVASFGREGATPVKLALAGAAVSAGLYSVVTGVTMSDLRALDELRFWQVGALAGRYWPVLVQVGPFLAVGILAALALGRLLNGLALGEDVAVALGQRVGLTRGLTFLVVAVLAGGSVAACGPIVFVGLVIPHLARALCGPDYRWILPYSAVLAPTILLAADIVGRVVLSPGELQVGVVLGVLGAPAFIALVRRANLAEL